MFREPKLSRENDFSLNQNVTKEPMFIFLAKISWGINVHKTKTRTSPEGPSSPEGPLSPTGPEQLKDSPLSPGNKHQYCILMFKFESFLSWL